MKKESGAGWKVGLFVITAFALFLSALFFIGMRKNLFTEVFPVKAYFNNVSGLKVGSNVRFGGIIVGTVDEIKLINDTTVRVVMMLQGNVERFIKKDATVNIGSDGLMGDKVVQISPGTPSQQEIEHNGVLSSHAPIEIDAILSSLKVSADHAAVITDQLSQMAYRINHGNGALSKLIGDSSFANNITKTVSNLKKSSQGLNENMEAAKHNFLLRGYFKKKQKEEEKKSKELEKKQQQQQTDTPGKQ